MAFLELYCMVKVVCVWGGGVRSGGSIISGMCVCGM